MIHPTNPYYQYSDLLNQPIQDVSLNTSGSPSTFQKSLEEVSKNNPQLANLGCSCGKDIRPLDCDAIQHDSKNKEKELSEHIQISIDNITNANTTNYQKVLPYKDKDGNYIKDTSPGKLVKSQHNLDFAIDGEGAGFMLANGSYTRDGRFHFNKDGLLVSESSQIPLKIKYTPSNSTQDWSKYKLQVTYDGKIYNKHNGQHIGTITTQISPQSRIYQGYIEKPNINVPLEIIKLSNKLRLMDMQRTAMSANAGLNREALNIARGSA